MKDFTKITTVKIPLTEIRKVYEHLQDRGELGVEGVALWSGVLDDSVFYITHTIIPEQTAFENDGGLLYMVDGEELHKINVFLFANELLLFAQIHSHPGAAYHSETDDAFPIVAKAGCLSIVVPNFGFGEQTFNNWAVYRLDKGKGWVTLSTAEIQKLIEIV